MSNQPILYISSDTLPDPDIQNLVTSEKPQISASLTTEIGGPFLKFRFTKTFQGKEETDETSVEQIDVDQYTLDKLLLSPAVQTLRFTELPTEMIFPPGHPLPEHLYRSHPINSSLYIPFETYDEVLYAEREAELVRLLVDLGATRIEISQIGSDSAEADIKTEAGVVAIGSINASVEGSKSRTKRDVRNFNLKGRKWSTDTSINVEDYAWLQYEPSWRAVAHARKTGACLSASIELNEEATFSLNAQLGLKGALAQLGAVSAKGGLTIENKSSASFMVKAEFCEVSDQEKG